MTDFTRMFSDRPAMPGRKQQMPRTTSSICTPALLAASAVSVAGLLGFVGLIIPHLTRLIIGSDSEYLTPCAAVFGATLVVLADTAARLIFRPVEIPVGVLMAFLGAPFFLYLLRKGVRK